MLGMFSWNRDAHVLMKWITTGSSMQTARSQHLGMMLGKVKHPTLTWTLHDFHYLFPLCILTPCIPVSHSTPNPYPYHGLSCLCLFLFILYFSVCTGGGLGICRSQHSEDIPVAKSIRLRKWLLYKFVKAHNCYDIVQTISQLVFFFFNAT